MCGYSIDIFTEEEAQSPVRAKRMKYLTTRDQVCPNCINTIGRCERVDAAEDEIPVMRAEVNEDEKSSFGEYCREKGYAVGTNYALKEFREGTK